MIINIPTEKDFYLEAENLINSAWNILIRLLEDCSNYKELDINDSELEKYWLSAKSELTLAMSLVQHSVEFYLKSKILAISPYLLISSEPRFWPKQCDKKDICFSDFRTLDAQDLLKVHNAFSTMRLSDDFSDWFNSMRTMRNKIMHTVDAALSIKPSKLAEDILKGHGYLVGDNSWINSRVAYLKRSPLHIIEIPDSDGTDSYIYMAIHKEISLTIDELSSTAVKQYLRYDKMKDAEECVNCHSLFMRDEFFDSKWTDDLIPTMQNIDANSKDLECVICGSKAEYLDKECGDCGRSLIGKDSNKCMYCRLYE